MKIAACAALSALVFAASAFAAAPPKPPADPEAVRGEVVFEQVGCYQCHGHVGQGSIMSGAALAPNPLPLTYYQTYVRNPRGQMPPYSPEILSETQLADIHAYLRSIPAAKAVKDIPLLSGR
jgi:ubiquinol-cytochrome c reductase cytochrome c subunit